MADRLYRSRDDRMLAGVAGGLARVMDADPSIIRVVWVLVTLLSGGLALIAYIVMAIVVPEAPDGWDAQRNVGSSTDPTAPAPGPVPPGGWVGPDGKVVAFAGTGPRAATTGDRPSSRGGRRAGAIVGLILILLGGAFLVREFMPSVDLSAVWPILSIGFGVVLLLLSIRPGRASD